MAVKVVTNFGVLMRLAKAQADAEKKGDAEEIAKAKEAHETYREQCLSADEMIIGVPIAML